MIISFHPLPLPSDPHVLNIRHYKPNGNDTVYIGRPSKWGNPYTVEKYGRTQAIQLYEQHLISSKLVKQVSKLRNKILLCYCSPKPCHGDVLAKYIYN
jgi:hypothetical protein